MATTVDRITLKSDVFKVGLALRRGATFRKTVTWKTGSSATPVDLTGCTAEADIRARQGSADVLVHLSTADGSIVLGGTAGTITLIVDDRANDVLPATGKAGVWDFELTYSDGSVRPLMAGAVSFEGEVTRPEGEP